MSLGHSPSVVTSGLRFLVDAGNIKSYPGTGTSWFDLSGYGNTATLQAGITYASGALTFPGTAMATAASMNLPQYTLEAWAKPFNNQVGSACIASDQYTSWVNYCLVFGSGTLNLYTGNYAAGWANTGSTALTNLTWVHLASTYDTTNIILYVNGAEVSRVARAVAVQSSGIAFRIGCRWDILDYFKGDITKVALYNRAITAAEVRQNFNALRGRFGL